jgi:uncharacterized protein YpmB
MKKKIIIVLISIISFFVLIFIAVPILIDNSPVDKSNNKFEFSELANKKSTLEKMEVEAFLNTDNLYENYTHNYTIKIPQDYTHNNGIGKYSSAQFYNENLGFVVAVNVGKTNFGKSIEKELSNQIIKNLTTELKNDNSLGKIFEDALIERGFYKPKLINYKVTNYNNRLFLKLNFEAYRIYDNEEQPVLISDYMTFHKDFAYHFQFVSYQKESTEKWNTEIQKSMSNVMISEYITKKN